MSRRDGLREHPGLRISFEPGTATLAEDGESLTLLLDCGVGLIFRGRNGPTSVEIRTGDLITPEDIPRSWRILLGWAESLLDEGRRVARPGESWRFQEPIIRHEANHHA